MGLIPPIYLWLNGIICNMLVVEPDLSSPERRKGSKELASIPVLFEVNPLREVSLLHRFNSLLIEIIRNLPPNADPPIRVEKYYSHSLPLLSFFLSPLKILSPLSCVSLACHGFNISVHIRTSTPIPSSDACLQVPTNPDSLPLVP